MKLTENTIIYIACPPNVSTGGPELLHQLTHILHKNKFNAKLLYTPIAKGDPIHENFKKYKSPYTFSVEDNEQNILIVPETRTYLLYRYKYIQKTIWWLSIDNYYHFIGLRKNKIANFIGLLKYFRLDNEESKKMIACHFVQSRYAEDHLLKKGIRKGNIKPLSDYIRYNFIESSSQIDLNLKQDIILYNPKKGISFTKKLIKLAPNLKWTPIINMTPNEVEHLMSLSKVYIDFGNHPGKDRIPREAALLYNCVITNKKGSAAFDEDVPIPEKYKMDERIMNPSKIINIIKKCVDNYSNEIKNFEGYRLIIKEQEKIFNQQVQNIFQHDLKK